MQTGAVTTSESTDEAPAAIALIGPGGTIERATTRFRERFGADEETLSAHQRKVDRIIAGEINHVAVMLDGNVADVSAVIAADGQRYALVSVPLPAAEPVGDSPNPLLEKPIEDSTAVVWLKGLDGRYLRVNGRYGEELQTDAEHVCGKTDAELSLSATIEGMRQGSPGGLAQEPLELEYTVGGHEARPAYSVVRFALRDRAGQPVAVCGVAAPLAQAWIARAECDRLMRIERWSRMEEAELREELLDEWGLAPLSETLVASSAKSEENEGEQFAAIAAELDTALATSARLDRELAEERRQVMALREASILSARRAHELLGTVTAERARAADLEHAVARAETRAAELDGELAAQRARADRLEARGAEAAETHRQTIDTLQLELAGLKEELERARAAASEAPTPEALQRARAEADEARRAAKEAQAACEDARTASAAAEAGAAEAAAELEAERGRALTLASELAAAREEIARVEQGAQEELTRVEQGANEEIARAQQALGEEVARAEEAAARAKAAAETEITRLGEELARVQSEAAAALEEERKTVSALRAELDGARQAAAHGDEAAETALAGARADLERAREELERVRSKSAAALEAERATAAALRAELDAAHQAATQGDQAAEAALAGVRAELERARAALEAERQRATSGDEAAEAALAGLRAELDAAHAALETERGTMAALRRELAAAGAPAAPGDEAALTALRAELERTQAALAAEQARAPQVDETALAAARSEVEAERERARALEAELEAARAGAPAAPPPTGGPHWDASAQRALAAALSDAGEWRMALQHVVKTLTAEGGWDAAIVFCPDERRRLLECAAISTDEALASTTFETLGWQHRPDVTRRELGGALGRSEPTAVTDLAGAEDRLLKAAGSHGMASAVLVPVRHGSEAIALLALLSRTGGAPAADLLVALEGIGLQVGAIGHLLTAAGAPRWRVGRL